MRSTTNPLVAMALAAFLVLVGLWMRGQPGETAGWLAVFFFVAGGLGFVGNVLVWRATRAKTQGRR